jgi:hypothetical protein
MNEPVLLTHLVETFPQQRSKGRMQSV